MLPFVTSDMTRENEEELRKIIHDNPLLLQITESGFALWHSERLLIDASMLSNTSNFVIYNDDRVRRYFDITNKRKKKSADKPICCSCHKNKLYFEIEGSGRGDNQ